jgi:hypothetical protein
LDITAKKRYLDKLCVQKSDGGCIFVPDPYNIPKEDWKNNVGLWPQITESTIKKYISSGPGLNYKSVSAYEYVVSGKLLL